MLTFIIHRKYVGDWRENNVWRCPSLAAQSVSYPDYGRNGRVPAAIFRGVRPEPPRSGRRERDALALLMAQYSDREFTFPESALGRIVIIRIDLDEITGKQAL
ncbi:MAG: hypothetical protein KAI66_08075 [Lentisphaeria bacterium]|nr:hypothetical protein [Lentisphaeria bacterium]